MRIDATLVSIAKVVLFENVVLDYSLADNLSEFSKLKGAADIIISRPFRFTFQVLCYRVNIIEMVVDNDKSLGGTTLATAPLVDCMKITTTATLKWTPLTSNLPE